MKSKRSGTLMKVRRSVKRTWLYTLLLGLVPAVVIILALPVSLDPYIIELKSRQLNRFCWFDDLESDGMKEKLSIGHNDDNTLYLIVYSDMNKHLGQFNFEYSPANSKSCFIPASVDINLDGTKEVVLFTQNEDSLFINAFDYNQLGISVESRFITTIGGYNEKQDYQIIGLGSFDTNYDSVDEFFFSVVAGFAVNPRQVYRYDFASDSLIYSVNTGASFLPGERMGKYDECKLFVTSSATGNIPSAYPDPYHDSCCWIFGFDQDLDLIFDPIPIGSYPSSLLEAWFIDNQAYFIYSSRNSKHAMTILYKMDMAGKIIDSLIIEEEYKMTEIWDLSLKDGPSYYLSSVGRSRKYIFDPESFGLYLDRPRSFFKNSYPVLQEDLNLNGRIEYLFLDKIKWRYVFYPEARFRKPIMIDPVGDPIFKEYANFYPATGKGEIILASKNSSEIHEYFKNPKYKFRFLYWSLIYAISVCFVSGIMYLQRRRITKQYRLEQQVAELQLQNLQTQLDPHFTFNALNSVGNAIYQENKEKAYDLFQRFTRMIRSSLMVSQQVFQTLEGEIQFTRDYLEFQKTRFRDKFDYTFDIELDIDLKKTKIPKMLIQSYAENAVKHAFHDIDYKGQITISVKKDPQGINIIIDDNGIGINRSKQLKATSGTQKGEQILKDQIRQINRLYDRKIIVNVFDKSEIPKTESGTRIELILD